MKPDPGTLDTRVQIQARTITRSNGEDVLTYTTAGTRWASIMPLSGREMLQSQSVQAEANVRIRIRYFAGLTTTHRVKCGSRIYDITHIADYRRGDEMELLCTEAV